MGSLDQEVSETSHGSKIIEIPAAATIVQMENSLNTQLNSGWDFRLVFNHNAKTYAVFVKRT